MQESINEHEGSKYLRTIIAADNSHAKAAVDVYSVIEAFGVTCPARAHAIKKLLCCGTRGKGDAIADLRGVLAATNRALDLEELRGSPTPPLEKGSYKELCCCSCEEAMPRCDAIAFRCSDKRTVWICGKCLDYDGDPHEIAYVKPTLTMRAGLAQHLARERAAKTIEMVDDAHERAKDSELLFGDTGETP